MTDDKTLVERLRAAQDRIAQYANELDEEHAGGLYGEAADAIERQSATIAALEKENKRLQRVLMENKWLLDMVRERVVKLELDADAEMRSTIAALEQEIAELTAVLERVQTILDRGCVFASHEDQGIDPDSGDTAFGYEVTEDSPDVERAVREVLERWKVLGASHDR